MYDFTKICLRSNIILLFFWKSINMKQVPNPNWISKLPNCIFVRSIQYIWITSTELCLFTIQSVDVVKLHIFFRWSSFISVFEYDHIILILFYYIFFSLFRKQIVLFFSILKYLFTCIFGCLKFLGHEIESVCCCLLSVHLWVKRPTSGIANNPSGRKRHVPHSPGWTSREKWVPFAARFSWKGYLHKLR